MPIYEYKAIIDENNEGCEKCRDGFDKIQKSSDDPIEKCPECGGPVKKAISSFGVTYGVDFRAKGTGLHKLVRKDKGVYEKKY